MRDHARDYLPHRFAVRTGGTREQVAMAGGRDRESDFTNLDLRVGLLIISKSFHLSYAGVRCGGGRILTSGEL